MTHVKICCISSRDEADLAIRHGAHALGLVSSMPTGVGVIPDDQIRELASTIPAGVRRFLLTSKRDPAEIAHQVREAGVDCVQLVERTRIPDVAILRRELPEASLVQVVHVTGPPAVEEAEAMAPYVDFLLLDTGTPDALNRELGGTGRTHDWTLSAEIVRRARVPIFLAGGLRPDNVAEAIRRVRPYGVDVCSRLRPKGFLDETLLVDFMEAVKSAGAAPSVERSQ